MLAEDWRRFKCSCVDDLSDSMQSVRQALARPGCAEAGPEFEDGVASWVVLTQQLMQEVASRT